MLLNNQYFRLNQADLLKISVLSIQLPTTYILYICKYVCKQVLVIKLIFDIEVEEGDGGGVLEGETMGLYDESY